MSDHSSSILPFNLFSLLNGQSRCHCSWFSCFSRYGKMQEFGPVKILSCSLTILRPILSVFPRAQSALSQISTLKSFQGMLKFSRFSSSIFNPYRGRWQVPVSSSQGSPMGTDPAIIWGGISWPFSPTVLEMSIPRSGEDFAARPLNVLLLD